MPIINEDSIIDDMRTYEFKRYIEDKPKIYCLEDLKNPLHIKMYLTEFEYSKTPEFRQKLYKVCS